MDEIQRVLCKLGRRDLAQKYYLKVADDVNETSPPVCTEPKSICYATKYDGQLHIHFKRVPGISCTSYGCIKEIAEKFYSEIYPRLVQIKETADKMGAESATIPIKDSIFIDKESLTCTMSIIAENLLIEQLIAVLELELKN